MKKTRNSVKKPISADAIARQAEQGNDVSHFFQGQGRMVQPIQRVNVDVTAGMLEELDNAAQDLNVSRQAVIKTLVRQALDQRYLAQRARQPQSARGSARSNTLRAATGRERCIDLFGPRKFGGPEQRHPEFLHSLPISKQDSRPIRCEPTESLHPIRTRGLYIRVSTRTG
jgi:hypothetical protein